MTMAEYMYKFNRLSYFAPHFFFDEKERVDKFVRGLLTLKIWLFKWMIKPPTLDQAFEIEIVKLEMRSRENTSSGKKWSKP